MHVRYRTIYPQWPWRLLTCGPGIKVDIINEQGISTEPQTHVEFVFSDYIVGLLRQECQVLYQNMSYTYWKTP
jgi:hypothetical protein